MGQEATITLDADPSKQLTGKVTAVANMGEQRPNADAKVFEVQIAVTGIDTTLRPGMTTGNAVTTMRVPDALYVSLEALDSDNGIPVVYHRDGGRVVKQEVETGATNDDQVVILRGLEEGDRVLLAPPSDAASLKVERLPGSTAGTDTMPQPPVPTAAPEDVPSSDTLRALPDTAAAATPG